jgi:hypothetical protein
MGVQQIQECREIFPNRRMPHTFLWADRRLRDLATFRGIRWDVGRQRSIRHARMEEQILEVAGRQLSIDTRRLAASAGSSHTPVHRILREQ